MPCLHTCSAPECVDLKAGWPGLLAQVAKALLSPLDLTSSHLILHGSVGFKSSRLSLTGCRIDDQLEVTEMAVSEPFMYGFVPLHPEKASVGRLAINLRASWMAGRPIFGDVILTRCRASIDDKVSCREIEIPPWIEKIYITQALQSSLELQK